MDPEKEAYWRGVTDSRIKALEESNAVILKELKAINSGVTQLMLWQAKVAAGALAISATISLAFEGVKMYLGAKR